MSTRWALGRPQGISEAVIEALREYEGGPFTEREKAAFRYTDQMYFDHHKVDDALFTELRAHFNDDEVLELSWVIAEFISVGKVIHVLGVPYGEQPSDLPGRSG